MTCNEELSIIKLLKCNCEKTNAKTRDTIINNKRDEQLISAWHHQYQDNMVKAKQNIQKKRKKKGSPKDFRKKKNCDVNRYNNTSKLGANRNELLQEYTVKNITVKKMFYWMTF